MPADVRFALSLLLTICGVAVAPSSTLAGPLVGERPVWFGIGPGFSGTAPAPDLGGGVAVNLTVGLRLFPISPELILREGVAGLGSDDLRHVAGVGGGVRFLLPRLAILRGTVRVAFAHQHELPWDEYTASIGAAVKSTFGVHEHIGHRSGFEVGGGLELTPDPDGRLGFYAAVNAIVLPGTAGPPLTVITEIGLSIAVGKPLK